MARLTLNEETNAEVRKNLLRSFGIAMGMILLLVLGLALAINPPGSTEGFRFGLRLLLALWLPSVPLAGALLALAYLCGDWPAFLRGRVLADLYGIDPEQVSNRAIRGWMKQPGYWAAFARGVAVAAFFIAPALLSAWWSPGKFSEGSIVPSLYLTVFAGSFAAKAWGIRRVAAGQTEA